MTTVTIDFTNRAALIESLRKLDSDQRERLLHAVQDLVSGDDEDQVLRTVRETITCDYPWVDGAGQRRPDGPGTPVPAQEQPMPVGVVFTTEEYNDGFYLTANGEVLFDNGEVDEVDFADLDDVFAGLGIRGPSHAMSVDLRTGKIDTDDNAEEDIHTRFGIAAPKRSLLTRMASGLGQAVRGAARDIADDIG